MLFCRQQSARIFQQRPADIETAMSLSCTTFKTCEHLEGPAEFLMVNIGEIGVQSCHEKTANRVHLNGLILLTAVPDLLFCPG